MKIDLEIKGAGSALAITLPLHISLPEFLKHAAIAGQGVHNGGRPTIQRAIGLLLYFHEYIDIQASHFSGFRYPTIKDPTELAQFSNIVGKAFADLVAKRYAGAIHTLTYEMAMINSGHSLTGKRPDFYCITATDAFALEAKGRIGSVSNAQMTAWKTQAGKGPLKVPRCFASAAHDLYGPTPGCRFHDPVGQGYERNSERDQRLVLDFYRSFLGKDRIDEPDAEIGDRAYAVLLTADFQTLQIRFVLDMEISNAISKGDGERLVRGVEPFTSTDRRSQYEEDRNFYMDKDGIGVIIELTG